MNTWKPDTFSAKELENKINSQRINVPKYQRGLVWSDKQKDRLIDTIKRGLPFGTILLYRAPNGNERIVDGLQRCSTIFEFMRNPAKYYCEADIDDAAIKKVREILCLGGNQNRIETEIKTCLLKWVYKDHPTMQDVELMQYYNFTVVLAECFPTARGKEREIIEIIKPSLKSYQTVCTALMDIKIPAIIVEGDEDVLPEVFERINSEGTKLTKYQIYAATWADDKYVVSSEKLFDIVKKNRDRYDEMLGDSKLELEDYDSTEFIRLKELNVFEIAFGFGKMMSEKFPALFETKKDASEVNSAGFTLFNACLGGKSADMKSLNKRIKEMIKNDTSLNMFIEKLISCIEYTDNLIGKYNKFKGNSQRATTVQPLHTELQICSIIAYLFIGKYANTDISPDGNVISYSLNYNKPNAEWQQNEKVFKSNVAKIYAMEIIQQRWMGSGDKKMDSILSGMTYYSRTVPKTEFSNALQTWFETMKNERREHTRVAMPKEPEKMILNLLYIHEFSAKAQIDNSLYDIEHLATKGFMKNHLDRFDGELRLPISSIGNLCLLPLSENRSKKDKTIYSDTEYLKKSKLSLRDLEDHFTFTNKTDLEWINDFTLGKDDFQSSYYQFIEKRFEMIKERIEQQYDLI